MAQEPPDWPERIRGWGEAMRPEFYPDRLVAEVAGWVEVLERNPEPGFSPEEEARLRALYWELDLWDAMKRVALLAFGAYLWESLHEGGALKPSAEALAVMDSGDMVSVKDEFAKLALVFARGPSG